MRNLNDTRKEIEEIDKQMLKLFLKRMNCSKDVILFKIENNLPILDSSRENLLIEKNSSLVSDETMKKYYIEFLKDVMNISREYQKEIMENE